MSSTGPIRARRRSRPTCRSRAPRWPRPSARPISAGIKVTGHLCSVTYSEAADLGIDNLEHGFLAATDFVRRQAAGRVPGSGPGPAVGRCARRERRAVQGAGEEADRQARGADVDADRVRGLDAGPAAAARARRADAAAEAAVRADLRACVAEQGVAQPAAVPEGAWRSNARSRAPAAC